MAHSCALMFFLMFSRVATLTIAGLGVGIMCYLAVSGEDIYFRVTNPAFCSLLLTQARPIMMNHHTSTLNYIFQKSF